MTLYDPIELEIAGVGQGILSGISTSSSVTASIDANGTVTFTATASGIDHNSLANLTTGDAHTQYLLTSGTRAMTGSLNMGTNSITNANQGYFSGRLASLTYIMGAGPDMSLTPVVDGQSVLTSWWGLQVIGNRQSNVEYVPSNIGIRDDFSVIIPNQQAAKVGLIVQGQSAQTGDLLQFRDSSLNVLSRVTSGGVHQMDNKDITKYKTVTADSLYSNGNSGTSKTINWNNGQKQKITMTGNCTFTFTNPLGPCNLVLEVLQDVTGGRTIVWATSVRWSGGAIPNLTNTANRTDLVSFFFDGTYYLGSIIKNFNLT